MHPLGDSAPDRYGQRQGRVAVRSVGGGGAVVKSVVGIVGEVAVVTGGAGAVVAGGTGVAWAVVVCAVDVR
jgi:hypothetical protein